MTKLEILREIEKEGLEVAIFNELHAIILYKLEKSIDSNCELKACIRAIKKLNNGKNEAIDAICE